MDDPSFGLGPFYLLHREPQLTILTICKGYKLPGSQSKEHIRPTFGNFSFPFGDTAFPTQPAALADAMGGFLNDFKKALVVLSGVGIVDLSKELIGKVAQ